ncbi:MAG: LamG domain-containing protein, partial [Clostridia bacterium]|nr:LamG domain-containing protein [Clostridia bacterium]
KQYLYLTIYSDRIEIERIKAATGKKIKDNWVLDLPLQKSTFKYTDARANDRTAPVFTPGSKAEAVFSGKNVTVTFDAAKHEDFVHSYRLKLYKNGESTPLTDILIFSDFYRGLENMSKTLSWTFQDVVEDYALFRIEIYPIESYGHVGEPLIYDFATVQEIKIQPFTRCKLFTVDFASGEARNPASALEVKRIGGEIGLDDAPGGNNKYCFKTADEARVNVTMTNSYYTLTQKKFTLEAAIRVFGFGSEQTVASCYSNGGVKLWIGADGKLRATVNKSDKTDLDVVSASALPLRRPVDVAAVYDGKALTLYVDGESVGSAALSGTINYNRNAKYGIGSAPNGDDRLNGVVYTASLDNNVYSAESILALHDAAGNGKDVRVLLPALEQLARIDMLRKVNSGNNVLLTILDYYELELGAVRDSYYVTSAIVSDAVAYRDLDADVAGLNGTALPAYAQPSITGITHKAAYDVNEGGAPVPTVTGATSITLDGENYTPGDPIGEGEHTLIAQNGWRMDGVQFEVYDSTYFAPVIYGVEDGKTDDVTKEEAPAITWEPAELQAQ